MICKYCGANFRRENLTYCPYCDMELPIDENNIVTSKDTPSQNKNNQEWDLDKLTEKRILVAPGPNDVCGTVKVTVKGNANMLSPATGSNYVMMFDGGAYQVRLSKGDNDISEFIELPVGSHEGILRFHSWRDPDLKHPETEPGDMITINVQENITTEIIIKTGALFTSRKISVIYNK